MGARIFTILTLVCIIEVVPGVFAQTIPCDTGEGTECMTAGTCQMNGFCHGEPINEGLPCTQNVSGACMTNPVCHQGVCTGTTPAPDGTACFFPGLEKCFAPGHCMSIPLAGISVCNPGAPKQCAPVSDPCQQAFCNPQTGDCEVADKCFTFSGCEACNNGTCTPVNIGGACTNPEGDFNPCTTDDRCAVLAIGAMSPLNSVTNRMPAALAAAMVQPEQTGDRGICMGVPVTEGGQTPTPTEVQRPTPTVPPGLCVGDCDGDGQVMVNELVLMVNIALGNTDISACTSGDADGSGDISINEIVTAVNNALNGCA